MRRNVWINLLLAGGVVLIVGAALLLDAGRSGDQERFVGSDSAATARIEEDHPDYVPWFTSVFSPTSSEVESGLFALQAAVGGVILGYVVAALRGRRKLEALRAELERT
ncbi:energy-coupling factor ABC transporter substrate-binding protein [Rhodococcus sp. MEB064]|uniref:energy-coupling factor ABC transporter substrate-binding protein n=1 Tax=Rhodococcus sp. MEB064 TaxID=1587522 RepID=UPI0005ACA753|nr:energy-coupling factor ABC transporter substrate-binding protein [Rhodococcus sp. MEB064]KIQ18146.1 cobalt transporter [Rhodococcus sp. MEB064]